MKAGDTFRLKLTSAMMPHLLKLVEPGVVQHEWHDERAEESGVSQLDGWYCLTADGSSDFGKEKKHFSIHHLQNYYEPVTILY
jgi:hypothetical protein